MRGTLGTSFSAAAVRSVQAAYSAAAAAGDRAPARAPYYLWLNHTNLPTKPPPRGPRPSKSRSPTCRVTVNNATLTLKEKNGSRRISMAVGSTEALAIAQQARPDADSARPATPGVRFDCTRPFSRWAAVSIASVVNDATQREYLAQIVVPKQGGDVKVIKARPGDAIALALQVRRAHLSSRTRCSTVWHERAAARATCRAAAKNTDRNPRPGPACSAPTEGTAWQRYRVCGTLPLSLSADRGPSVSTCSLIPTRSRRATQRWFRSIRWSLPIACRIATASSARAARPGSTRRSSRARRASTGASVCWRSSTSTSWAAAWAASSARRSRCAMELAAGAASARSSASSPAAARACRRACSAWSRWPRPPPPRCGCTRRVCRRSRS